MPTMILNNSDKIKLNDFNELEFKTDEKGFPINICSDDQNIINKEKFLIEIHPRFIAYQMINLNSMLINLAIEIVESRYNTDKKPLGILTDKNLYLVLSVIVIFLIACLCFCKNRLKKFLLDYVMLNSSRTHHHHNH